MDWGFLFLKIIFKTQNKVGSGSRKPGGIGPVSLVGHIFKAQRCPKSVVELVLRAKI
jgi:hypothetical protein